LLLQSTAAAVDVAAATELSANSLAKRFGHLPQAVSGDRLDRGNSPEDFSERVELALFCANRLAAEIVIRTRNRIVGDTVAMRFAAASWERKNDPELLSWQVVVLEVPARFI